MINYIRNNLIWLVIGGMLIVATILVIKSIGEQKQAKSELYSGCVKTDLRVYVPGRVGQVLQIYDCGDINVQ